MKYVRLKAVKAKSGPGYVKLLQDYEEYLAGTVFEVIKDLNNIYLVESLDGERVTLKKDIVEIVKKVR